MVKNKSKLKRRRPKRRPAAGTALHTDSLSVLVEAGLSLQKAGNLNEAKEIYCQVLAKDPLHSDAWHLLGMTLYSAGASTNALECLEKAREISGNHPELLANLAVVHHACGNTEQAIAIMGHLVASEPGNANHLSNLGVFYLESDALQEAELQFKRALEADSASEQAGMNLANCWVRQNRLHDAESLYRELLNRNPSNLSVLGNLGECYRRQCKWEQSLAILIRVIQENPSDLVSRMTHARTLVNLGRLEEAAERFKRIVCEFPDYSKAHHYLGTVLLSMDDVVGAEAEMQRALELAPNDAHALCSLGFAYIQSDRRAEGTRCFQEAVRIDPGMSGAHGCLLYLMCGDPEVTPEKLFEEHVRWGEIHGNVQAITSHPNLRNPQRRLRIGYASADFRTHAVAAFFEPLLRLRDVEQFEIFCYFESGVEDQVTAEMKASADHWRVTLGYSDEQVAQQIMDDEIDILVDLAGHTSGNRLPAWAYKPAPIQISWLGYPNTTGLKAIDYCLTCDVQNPVGEPTLHTEELIRIPGGSFCFAPPKNAPEIAPLPALERGYITLGSFHRPFKISSTTHDLWAAALKANPDAKLLAFNTRFNDPLKEELMSALIRRGIERERIEIRNTYSGDSYLETYREVDIGLDVTPWAGGTTTMEALWMGIPVIGFYGKNRPARGTAGIVHHLGRPDWIAKSERDYADKVAELSTDIQELERLRGELREMTRATIADEQRFVTELESAYRMAWKRWCDETSNQGTQSLPSLSSVHPIDVNQNA